jgi:hypothetical protein
MSGIAELPLQERSHVAGDQVGRRGRVTVVDNSCDGAPFAILGAEKCLVKMI